MIFGILKKNFKNGSFWKKNSPLDLPGHTNANRLPVNRPTVPVKDYNPDSVAGIPKRRKRTLRRPLHAEPLAKTNVHHLFPFDAKKPD
jgi:hypothetical protein